MAVEDIVTVGGGLAGATAVKTLPAEGFEGPVTLIADEDDAPYLRPLSKEYLTARRRCRWSRRAGMRSTTST